MEKQQKPIEEESEQQWNSFNKSIEIYTIQLG